MEILPSSIHRPQGEIPALTHALLCNNLPSYNLSAKTVKIPAKRNEQALLSYQYSPCVENMSPLLASFRSHNANRNGNVKTCNKKSHRCVKKY